LTQCTKSKATLIIGHRGAKGHIVENTLESIEKAMELGVDGIEIDVFKCKSGELVVFHDKSMQRLTGISGYIEAMNLDSIRKIKVLNNYKIPTLNEVLDLIDGKVFLNIELKGSQTAKLTHQMIELYIKEDNWTAEKFIISSFDWSELSDFYELNKEVPIAILTDADPLDALPMAGQIKAVAINPNFKSLNPENIKIIQQSGYKVYPYTINKKDDIAMMISLNVDGIITDFPERVREVLTNP
jgi:glycerophosphoryl diester phosphodiesterase